MNKKYAVLWASTENIGDDIQTLAAINFLAKKGVGEYSYIDRENLCNYTGEPVNLIMNGWFMHKLYKFLPPPQINPIFISFHVSNERLITNNLEYFQKYQPIGCRDQNSVDWFHKYGVDAYFTGCLTLIFDEYLGERKGKYLTDMNTDCWYIPNVDFDKSRFRDFTEIESRMIKEY